ncbi:MAG TPA: winged helix DNA-binding domain-containing protein [Acidimicrobiia bacterium]|nr:winged helix DNA-binding domain-containing protein [Acidimicrobiia bacterium]
MTLDPRSLSTRQINRAVLARQHLLERSQLPIRNVVEGMAGIQAQYAPSMYISLWSRMAGFQRHHLTTALEEKEVVQGTLMRATIHLVSAADYWPLAIAIRRSRRDWWLRVQPSKPDPGAMEAAAGQVAEFLAEGPRHRREIEQLVGKETARGVGMFIDLLRVPPLGTWERRRADLYADAAQWLGPPPELNEAAALDYLVRRYLEGFGPAQPADIALWAGVNIADVTPSLDRLELRHFSTEDGLLLVDLPNAPIPGNVAAPIRFIPTWDAILLIHARRAAILPEEYRPRIFSTKIPQSVPTFLVDGSIAGVWRESEGRIKLEPFHPLPSRVARHLETEAKALEGLFV